MSQERRGWWFAFTFLAGGAPIILVTSVIIYKELTKLMTRMKGYPEDVCCELANIILYAVKSLHQALTRYIDAVQLKSEELREEAIMIIDLIEEMLFDSYFKVWRMTPEVQPERQGAIELVNPLYNELIDDLEKIKAAMRTRLPHEEIDRMVMRFQDEWTPRALEIYRKCRGPWTGFVLPEEAPEIPSYIVAKLIEKEEEEKHVKVE